MLKLRITSSQPGYTDNTKGTMTLLVFKPRTKTELIKAEYITSCKEISADSVESLIGRPEPDYPLTFFKVQRNLASQLEIADEFSVKYIKDYNVKPTYAIVQNFNNRAFSSFSLISADQSKKYCALTGRYESVTHSTVILKARDIKHYLRLEKLFQNPHLLHNLEVDNIHKICQIIKAVVRED